MTCESCGEKPKKTDRKFTGPVIEINNPEQIVLLRKVVIPTSMGTEEQVPAAVGKYRNVVLKYEANNHVYIYSSDGIPTLLEMDVPQEIWDNIEELQEDVGDLDESLGELQQEFDDFKNSPDVVDIVATYADLQAYDTSTLGDKDIVRVLQDETHDGESTYYKWDKPNNVWVLIGEVGPYYTKSEVDTALAGKQNSLTAGEAISITNDTIKATNTGLAKTLTADDYNWNSTTRDATEPYDSVALWLLQPGLYILSDGISGYIGSSSGQLVVADNKRLYQITPNGTYGVLIVGWMHRLVTTSSPFQIAQAWNTAPGNSIITNSGIIGTPIDSLDSNQTGIPLSAFQGKVLNGKIGDLTQLTTQDKQSLVTALNQFITRCGYNQDNSMDTLTEWVDDVPIKKITKKVASLPNNSSQTFSLGLSNVKDVVKIEIVAHDQVNNIFKPIPDGAGASAELTSAGMSITTTADYSGYSAYITIYYTEELS